jgi:hypothetical protein
MSGTAGVKPTVPTTSPGFALNDIAWDRGKAYRYVQANGAITKRGSGCTIGYSGQAIMYDTGTAATFLEGDAVGIALAAFADNDYGWLQVYGLCPVDSEQDALANKKLGGTSTGGHIDDAAATGLFINGLHLGVATGASDAINETGFIKWATVEIQMEPET